MEDCKTTVAIDGHEIHDYKTVQPDFMAALKTKIREVMTATFFPPCKQEDCASFCPFLELCRRKTYTFE
jgi:hypothetical protein